MGQHASVEELFYNRIALEGMVLKPNMAVPGKKSSKRASDVIEAFGGLGQKFTQQLIHERLMPPAMEAQAACKSLASTKPLKGRGSLLPKRLISVAE